MSERISTASAAFETAADSLAQTGHRYCPATSSVRWYRETGLLVPELNAPAPMARAKPTTTATAAQSVARRQRQPAATFAPGAPSS